MRRTLFAAGAMLMLAQPDAAADFTFKVPISIHNMPAQVTNFTVNVVLLDATWDPKYADGMHRVGYGSSPQIPLVNGAYEGTYTLTNDTYDARRHPQEAVYYRVYIVLHPQYEMQKTAGSCNAAYNQTSDYPFDLSKPCLTYHVGKISEANAPATMTPTGQGPNQPPKPRAPRRPIFHLPPPPPH